MATSPAQHAFVSDRISADRAIVEAGHALVALGNASFCFADDTPENAVRLHHLVGDVEKALGAAKAFLSRRGEA